MKLISILIISLALTTIHTYSQQDDLQKYLNSYIETGSASYSDKIHEQAAGSKYDLFCQLWSKRISAPAEALNLAGDLISQHPDFPEAHMAMGYLQMEEEVEYETAIKHFDQAISLNQDLYMAIVFRGLSRIYLKDYKAALDDFEVVLSKNRNNALAALLRGVARYKTGDVSTLVSDFEIAIQMDSEIISEYFYPYVKESLDKALELSPGNVNFHYARGVAGFRQGLWKSALEDFTMAIQIIPGNASYYKYAGACSYFLKDREGAEGELKKALGIDPDDPETYYYLGLVATNLKNLPKQGHDYMTHAIELDPSQADYYYQRAKSSYELNDYNETMEDVQKSLDMHQGNGNYFALRGMTRLQLKFDDELICEDFNRAYELGTFYKIRKQYKKHCE